MNAMGAELSGFRVTAALQIISVTTWLLPLTDLIQDIFGHN